MLIGRLFVYYFLARNEEWRMQIEQPAAYESYMAQTPMFLPGEPGGVFPVVLTIIAMGMVAERSSLQS